MKWMHSDVEKVIVEWAYGRVLSRPSDVLTTKDRELYVHCAETFSEQTHSDYARNPLGSDVPLHVSVARLCSHSFIPIY